MTLRLAHHTLPSQPLYSALRVASVPVQVMRECIMTYLWIAASHKEHTPHGWYERAAEAYAPGFASYHGREQKYLNGLRGWPNMRWAVKMLNSCRVKLFTESENTTLEDANTVMAWAARLVWSFDYESYSLANSRECSHLLHPLIELRRLMQAWDVDAGAVLEHAEKFSNEDEVSSLLYYGEAISYLCNTYTTIPTYGNRAGLMAHVVSRLASNKDTIEIKDLHEDTLMMARRYRMMHETYNL